MYHPVDSKEYERFNNALPSLFGRVPRDSGIIIGHAVNANVGIWTDRLGPIQQVVGPNGPNNKNKKGTTISHFVFLKMRYLNIS